MACAIIVDSDRCAGHGRCYALVPELFDCDDSGYPVVLHETVDSEHMAMAENAIANCPEGAISLAI